MARDPGRASLYPGLVHTGLFAALAFLLAHFTAPYGLEAAALAVLLGVVAGNLVRVGPVLAPGVRFAGRRILTVAVVLLGLRVTVHDLLALGGSTVLIVLAGVAGAVVVALLLGRLAGVRSPLAALIGVGTGICGASAIAALRNTVGAEEEDVTYAIASVAFLGSIGLLAYPVLQLAFHPLDVAAYGVWSGATLHAVPQAIGAAFGGGGVAAGAPATVVKLGRVALLAPLAVGLGMAFRHRARGRAGTFLPVEVWGFMLLFVLGSVLQPPERSLAVVEVVDRVALVFALTALGLQTRFSDLKRAGAAPLGIALATWLLLSLGVFAALALVG